MFCAGLGLFYLYRVVAEGQNSWEDFYGAYAGIVLFIIQVVLLKLFRVLETANRDQIKEKLKGVWVWSPLIGFSLFIFIFFWPMVFSPVSVEPWRICTGLFIIFCIGAFLQFIYFASTVPQPSKVEMRAAVKAVPWLRRFVLDRSLHAGLALLDAPAPKTAVLAEELSTLPFERTFTFRTQFDDQEQAILDLFWDVYGQKFHCERFVISDIPKGVAGENKFEVEISIHNDRSIQCDVFKPLKVERMQLE